MLHYDLTKYDGKEAIWLSDVDREKFVIKPFSIDFDDDYDKKGCMFKTIPYTICIGDDGYKTGLSAWSNNLELIRHSIENYVFTGKTTINLNNEDSPSQIMLERQRILDHTVEAEKGKAFYWKDVVRVIVKPDDFCKDGSVLFGICDEKQVIKEIYESLLYIGKRYYNYGKEMKEAWGFTPIDFYNKIKSPIIEDYISPREDRNKCNVQLRQVKVEHILRILCEFCCSFWDERGAGCGDVEIDDVADFDVDGEEYKIKIPGLYKWYKDFEDGVDNSYCALDESFDVDSWNEKGLALAAELRKQLPPYIDLWYDNPYKDKKIRDKRPQLIYNK